MSGRQKTILKILYSFGSCAVVFVVNIPTCDTAGGTLSVELQGQIIIIYESMVSLWLCKLRWNVNY